MEIYTRNLIYNHRSMKNVNNLPRFSMKHTHNTYELIFFEHGEANYVVESRRYRLNNHDLILTKPGTYHYIEIQSSMEYSRYNVAFNPDLLGDILSCVPPDVEVINCPLQSIIAENFRRMDYYSSRLTEENFKDVLIGLLKEIFYNLSFVSLDVINLPSELSPSITRALDYINRNLFTIKSVKEVCEQLNFSESYFFKLFNDQLKITPLKYINLKRLRHAQTLIQSGKKPSEVYLECGFDSYVGFYKQYLKIFNHSPSRENTV